MDRSFFAFYQLLDQVAVLWYRAVLIVGPSFEPHHRVHANFELASFRSTRPLWSAVTFINCNFLCWLAAIDGEDRTVNKQITTCF